MMGDKVRRPASGGIPFDVTVAAGAAIEDVVVLRNNEPVYTHPGGGTHVEFRWTDPDPPGGAPLWYYVRATVAPEPDVPDGRVRLAWSSPIWFFDDVPPPRRFGGGRTGPP